MPEGTPVSLSQGMLHMSPGAQNTESSADQAQPTQSLRDHGNGKEEAGGAGGAGTKPCSPGSPHQLQAPHISATNFSGTHLGSPNGATAVLP